MKLIISGIMLTLLCLLGGCDDKLEVQQAYDFSLTSWYLQKTISPDETVEIRLTLNRSGNYEEAGYQIGYIQMEGSGEVYDKKKVYLVNREMQPLDSIAELDDSDPCRQLAAALDAISEATACLSDRLAMRYFTHIGDVGRQTLAA